MMAKNQITTKSQTLRIKKNCPEGKIWPKGSATKQNKGFLIIPIKSSFLGQLLSVLISKTLCSGFNVNIEIRLTSLQF